MHDFLKTDQINSIRSEINKRISDVQARLYSPYLSSDENGMTLADPNDRASLETDRTYEQAQKAREKQQLGELQETLVRMRTDLEGFGFCESCGIEIDFDRLLSVPTSCHCMECQRISEIKKKAMH
ncbi:DnaK suppressor protein [Vibrio crassostreae]|nr:DksA C4-type domain-containing protein [Vibrio chagasii]CAK2858546.1 DnaK suppressor protein [Vibrio crassostreae]